MGGDRGSTLICCAQPLSTVSLRRRQCGLRSGLTLSALALLLVNDHLTEVTVPSPLTEESERLRRAVLFAIRPWSPRSARQWLAKDNRFARGQPVACGPRDRVSAVAVWALVLVVFHDARTYPWHGRPGAALSSATFSITPVIYVDPTDLIALAMLSSAHRLWRRN